MNSTDQPLAARPSHALRRHPWASIGRAAAVASIALLAGSTFAACGGSSVSSDAVPKSTPDIIPPTDTSAEKASAPTTSTSTTSKGASGATSSTGASSEEASSGESSGEPSSSESSSGSAGGGAAGGTAAEKEKASEPTKGTGEASPTGGANAP